jgi:hypothetical protein
LLALEVVFKPLFRKSVGTFGDGYGDAVFTPSVNFGSIGVPAFAFTVIDII